MKPTARDLAPNVDALTREYVDAMTRDAVAPLAAMAEEIRQLRAALKAAEPPAPVDTRRLADEIAKGLSTQVQAAREEARGLHRQGTETAMRDRAERDRQLDRLERMILDLDVRIQRYQSYDRYSITRAHVVKAMAELAKEKRT
jgi:hypothetical protein